MNLGLIMVAGTGFEPATSGERVHIFQSTLPVRGATCRARCILCHLAFQSTLPVRGATANALKIGRIYAFHYSTSA